jgi:hypothetical protein
MPDTSNLPIRRDAFEDGIALVRGLSGSSPGGAAVIERFLRSIRAYEITVQGSFGQAHRIGQMMPGTEQSEWIRQLFSGIQWRADSIRESARELARFCDSINIHAPHIARLYACPADITDAAEVQHLATEFERIIQGIQCGQGVRAEEGYCSSVEVAKGMGCPDKAEAIRKKLERLIASNKLPDGAWIENADPSSRQAKRLFKLSVVRPLLA